MEIMWLPHPGEDQSLEAKIRWFRSLTVEERLDHLCSYVDRLLEENPDILKSNRAEPVEGRVQVFRA